MVWKKQRRMRTEGEMQVDEDSVIRHARLQGRWMRMAAETAAEM